MILHGKIKNLIKNQFNVKNVIINIVNYIMKIIRNTIIKKVKIIEML